MQFFLPLATFQIKILLKEWIWEFASLSCIKWCIKKVWGWLIHYPEQFLWEAFLRSSMPWEVAIALTWPPNKTLKVSLFGYLISSRIILDLNDLLSEELKRYDTYFIKLIDMNCKCLLDFVNPALPFWSDEFGITCDHTNILCHVFLLKSVISSHNNCVGKIWAKLGPMLWKVRKQALSISFFHILHGEYLLKENVVVVQTPEWKFKAKIATNATHKLKDQIGPNLCPIWVKNGQKLIILKNFTLFSQS